MPLVNHFTFIPHNPPLLVFKCFLTLGFYYQMVNISYTNDHSLILNLYHSGNNHTPLFFSTCPSPATCTSSSEHSPRFLISLPRPERSTSPSIHSQDETLCEIQCEVNLKSLLVEYRSMLIDVC